MPLPHSPDVMSSSVSLRLCSSPEPLGQRRSMTILKWLLIVLLLGYLSWLSILFFKQRSMLFPIPPVGRTAPAEAGLPQAEEHVLTTADNEKVIVWHVPAQPGRPVVLFFPGNADILAGRVSR